MKKNLKIILILFGIFTLIGLAMVYFLRKDKKGAGTDTPDIDPADFPLMYGSRGNAVVRLQMWLNINGPLVFVPLVEDGIFGVNTQIVLKNTLNTDRVSYELFNSKKM
jgi:hypothetical protein